MQPVAKFLLTLETTVASFSLLLALLDQLYSLTFFYFLFFLVGGWLDGGVEASVGDRSY